MNETDKDAQAKLALQKIWPGYFKISKDLDNTPTPTVNLHLDVMFGLNRKMTCETYDEMSSGDIVAFVRQQMIPRITHDIVSQLVGETKMQMHWDRWWRPIFKCKSCGTEFAMLSSDGKMPEVCPRCGRLICGIEEVGE